MTKYDTNNPIGSPSVKDVNDNSINFDHATNDRSSETWQDRLGRLRKTWHGLELANLRAIADFKQESINAIILAGYVNIDSFQDGAVITERNEALHWLMPEGDGDYYRWDGPLPKNVPENSTPYSTGGMGKGAWINVGDGTVRKEVDALNQYAVNPLKYKNPVPQKHDFAFVAAKFIREKTELVVNPSSLLQSIDFTVPATSQGDITFKIHVTGLESAYDFSLGTTSQSEAFVVAGVCDGLLRENWAGRAHTVAYDGNILIVTLPQSALVTGFASVGVRLGVNATESFEIKKISAFQNGKRIAFLPLNRLPPKSSWGGASVLRTKCTGLGFDFGINLQLGKESLFKNNNFLTSSPSGSLNNMNSQEWSLELNRRFAVFFPQFNKWYFEPGVHSAYRRTTTLSFLKESYVLGDDATVLGGVELGTGSWVSEGEFNGLKVFSALYDYDSNPEAAIRNGTKQPFLAVRVPDAKRNSVNSYALKNVDSIESVKSTEYSYYYEHATMKAYFNWGKGNDNAYLYVCEVDNIIKAESTIYAAGCEFYASKSDTVKVEPANYNASRFAGFYQCGSGVSAGGSGAFAINNIDSECIMSTAKSHKNDGFNYHYAGTSLIKDCVTSHNGDDGISHHEGCEGYVVGVDILYNYAAASVPAFGAKVWHYRCNATPPGRLSSKPYAGKYACISGQGQSTEAWYYDCYLSQGGGIAAYYSCQSQEPGTEATIYIHSAQVDEESIKLYEMSAEGAKVLLSSTKNF
ncbi:hypothetical protein [Providencia sp. PROV024]|uniref:tail fiber/spike domain-containing protein n=1 Tax=Providencia sp. PROV024 TaxID=2949758 RepID=UPI00234BA19C|nr:hypothetical protein [Providencia sp. PROV024]WOC02879.1 hypothetical protein P3L56_13790 [Providencia sp. PROV024]